MTQLQPRPSLYTNQMKAAIMASSCDGLEVKYYNVICVAEQCFWNYVGRFFPVCGKKEKKKYIYIFLRILEEF